MKFIIYALSVWRISKLLVSEDGPYDIFRRLRVYSGVEYSDFDRDKVASWPDWNPLTCICCTSIYVAVALYKAPESLRNMLAASAVAIFADKLHSLDEDQNK